MGTSINAGHIAARGLLAVGAGVVATVALTAGLLALPLAGAYAQEDAGLPVLEAPPGTPASPPTTLRVLSDNPAELPVAHPAVNLATLCGFGTTGTIPLWQDQVHPRATLGGGTDTFCMVGRDPIRAGNNAATTVPTVIVPIIWTFKPQNVTFDPTTRDAACEANSALNLTLLSPIFKNSTLKVGPVVVGTGQYSGNFQRANFFRFTKPGAINPKFNLVLSDTALKGQGINATNFPNPITTPCPHGTGHLGFLEIGSLDKFIQTIVFPALKAQLKPNTFPIFLFYNVVEFSGTLTNCCILGYHNAFANPSYSNEFQTYGVVDFDMSNAFGSGVSDVSVMSHEVEEWQDDPTTGIRRRPGGISAR
jgi:hypothetical protein